MARDVRHYLPGGREHGGGIGRLVGYVVDALGPGAGHAIRDTRGARLRLRSGLLLARWMAVLVRDRLAAPDRVHHFHVAGRGSTWRKLALTFVARRLGCRHVLHLHDYDYAADFARRPDWQRRAVARMFRGAERVIVLGRRDRETMAGLLGLRPERITVLPNCVPDPGPRPPRAAEAPLRLVFLGQLGPRKGVPVLLGALADPAMPRDGWTATLAGDGPVETYRAEVAALGLSDRVTFTGWLAEDATRRLCAASDVLVLPSEAEGLAMAVLEGMAQGHAVVTTRVGAHDEVLTDAVDGLFVPVGDAPALARALARLVADPDLVARLGQAARARYLSTYGTAAYLRRLAAVYADGPSRISRELEPA